jgi:ATP-binding cassette, subfamily B, multidrug efflux pump
LLEQLSPEVRFIPLPRMKHLLTLNHYLYKYKYHLGLGIFFVITSNIFGLFPPIVIRYALDLVRDNLLIYKLMYGFSLQEKFQALFGWLLFYFGAAILVFALIKGILMFFMRQTIIVMSRLVEYDQKNDLYAQYQRLDAAFYKRNNTGDLMSRITEDVSRVRMYLGPAIMYAVNTAAMFIMVIYTMFKVNPYLSFFVLLPLPILSYSIYKVSSIINRKSEKIQAKLSGLTSQAQEAFSGIRVLQSFAREKSSVLEFDEQSRQYKSLSLDLARTEAFFAPLMLLLIGVSTILAVYIGGNEVIRGRFTTGNIAEFVYYINMLTWPVASLGWVISLIQRAEASQRRINEFLDTKPDIVNMQDKPLHDLVTLEFRNVSFTYPDTGISALKEVSFAVPKGKKIAIVGRTASGKSTIAELIVRNYDPTSGEITFNGQSLRTLNLDDIRKLTGYVPQEVFLFSDTVSNNIRFGNDKATQEEVAHFARTACVYNDIAGLPKQFDTIVGERGVMLSGGQKQRISIARALIKDPELVMLDDCLSAVDAGTEKEIMDNFSKELRDKTVIFITHRIFAVMDFDEILVLDEGRIAERGSHAALMQQKSIYYELYQLQQAEETVEN